MRNNSHAYDIFISGTILKRPRMASLFQRLSSLTHICHRWSRCQQLQQILQMSQGFRQFQRFIFSGDSQGQRLANYLEGLRKETQLPGTHGTAYHSEFLTFDLYIYIYTNKKRVYIYICTLITLILRVCRIWDVFSSQQSFTTESPGSDICCEKRYHSSNGKHVGGHS